MNRFLSLLVRPLINQLRKELAPMKAQIEQIETLAADLKTRNAAIAQSITDSRTQLSAAQAQIKTLQDKLDAGETLGPDDLAALTQAAADLQSADDSAAAAQATATPAPAPTDGGGTTGT